MSSTQTDIQQPVGKNYPRLVADIGGTNARFAPETAPPRAGAELVPLVVENTPVPESPAEDTDPALRTDDRSYRQNTGGQTDAVPAEAPHESATVLSPAVSVSEGLRHGGFGLIGMRDPVAQRGSAGRYGCSPRPAHLHS